MVSIFYINQNDFKIQIEGVTSIFKKGQNLVEQNFHEMFGR